jgi:hypothetical protein
MGHYVRRRVASIQLSFAAGALGLLAGIGLGRGTEPPRVDAEPAAKKTITITGSNIVDGSVKYQDLNKASIQKGIYLKAQVDRLFLKLTDADARFNKLITNELGYVKLTDADARFLKLGALDGYLKLTDADARFLKLGALDGYIKLTDADARFLKLGALDGYLKLTDADGRFLKLGALDGYLKLTDADARFLKLGALDGYIKLTDADARFLKLGALDGYLKLTDADGRFLKLGALDGYLKLTDADGRFLKLEDADARIQKVVGDAGYIKGEDADARYVEGDGSVRTASQLVSGDHQTLVALGKTMAMDDWDDGQGRGVNVAIKNLSEGTLAYASTATSPQGGTYHGTIDKGGSSEAILIGLLQPATLQIVDRGDGSVHTLTITAFDKGAGQLQITAQALSGAPPAG